MAGRARWSRRRDF